MAEATMPAMLGYTVYGSLNSPSYPFIRISQPAVKKVTTISPANPADGSYWFVILDANNPLNKVAEFIVPGNTGNSAVPSGLDTYMSSPKYLFAVVTQSLSNAYVPQGDLYDYLVKHGAGRELQRLEALNIHSGCGQASRASYLLTGVGGTDTIGTYEAASINNNAMLIMSLMPMPNGQPPYSICNSYTFWTR